jgi:hypothetical protein
MNKKNLLLLLLVIFSFSCGTTNQEDIEDAIFHAKQLLTGGRCGEALEALTKVPYQASNPDFLTVTASAQGCLGGYNTPTFFLEDLDKLGTGQTTFLGSLATFSTSNMTTSMDANYNSIESAINTLLYGGGISEVSFANRSGALTSSANNNISVFALYMILVELGKFTNFYGDANDTTGVKGGGGNHDCYIDYNDGDGVIAGVLGALAGTCTAVTDTSQGDLDMPAGRAKACDGIILMNNFLDIIGNVSFSGSNSGDLGDLASLGDLCAASGQISAATCSVKTHATCLNDTTNITDQDIERYFAIVFETMHDD